MSNRYGIEPEDERRLRETYTRCVYCNIKFRKGPDRRRMASIEHIKNVVSMRQSWNLPMCCMPCNSSKGQKDLRTWLRSPYCVEAGITPKTVAPIIRRFLRRKKGR